MDPSADQNLDPEDSSTRDLSQEELNETFIFDVKENVTERIDVDERMGDQHVPFARLGEYQILRKLGAGGMGEVYLGFDEKLHREVAIKVLPAVGPGKEEHVQRFENEARAAAKLIHPHIVPIFYIGVDGDHHYFVMQFIDGHSLAEALRDEGQLPADKALDLIGQIASGLAEAHQHGLIHRDIKPANIMIDPKSHKALLADFGLVKSTNSMFATTQAGTIMGALDYMSPEQGQGKPVDPRSDLYSLGATLYHLLGGKPPFQGDSAASILYQHVHEVPTSLTEINSIIDAPTATIVQRLMAKDPDQRYQSADDVIRDIQAVQSGKAPADPDAGRQRNRTVGWMIAGVAAGLVLLIAGGWWLYKSGDQVADADSESTLTDGVPMTTVGMDNPGLSILPEDDMLNYISFLDLEADCEGDLWRKEDDLIILDDPSKPNRLAVPIRVNQPHDFEVHYRSVEGQGGVDLLIPVGAIGMLKLRVGFNDGNGYELVGLKGSTDSEDYGANSDPNFPFPKDFVS